MKITGKRFIMLLVLVGFVLRLPTFFNDYYDVDELSALVQTKQYYSGLVPNVDFKESKLPAYHAIFKASYYIAPEYGWVIVHLCTAIIVILTALVVFLIGRRITDDKTARLAALFYVVFVSSFNRYFMATNGEVIYNLPVAASFLLFMIILESKKISTKILLLPPLVACAIVASQVKFHGIIGVIIPAIFLVSVLPAQKNMFNRKTLIVALALLLAAISAFIFDFFVTKVFAKSAMEFASRKIFYATAVYGLNPVMLILKFIQRQGILIIWQSVLWLPFFIYCFHVFRNKEYRKFSDQFLFIFFCSVMTYLMVFSGGSRLYFHYFMSCLPFVSLFSAVALNTSGNKLLIFMKKHLVKFILVPAVFFFVYNSKDILIKYYAPSLFTHESKASFLFRLAALGTTNDYLIPDSLYIDVPAYIKKTTKKTDTIFVWGDGAYIYYFSDRLPALKHMWPKTDIVRMYNIYTDQSATPENINIADTIQDSFIGALEDKKAAIFVDTSKAATSKFGSISQFTYPIPAKLKKYLEEKYTLEKTINNFGIYRRK